MQAPCGLVTLLTDFGLGDPFVGVMKGVLFGEDPDLRVIDLTHGIGHGAVVEGAFWLERSYRYFPHGSVHCAVVDPGVGTARAAVAVAAERHFFVGPDNGLLAEVTLHAPHVEVLLTEDTPSLRNPLGVKGVGEAGITGVGAAVASAIDDALGLPGAVTQLPVTPQRIRAILRNDHKAH